MEKAAAKQNRQRLINYLELWLLQTHFKLSQERVSFPFSKQVSFFSLIISFWILVLVNEGWDFQTDF